MIKVVTTNVQTTACVNMDTGLIFLMVAPPFFRYRSPIVDKMITVMRSRKIH